jgi:hypothetical protein
MNAALAAAAGGSGVAVAAVAAAAAAPSCGASKLGLDTRWPPDTNRIPVKIQVLATPAPRLA